MEININPQQLSTILAALRHFQITTGIDRDIVRVDNFPRN